VVLRELCAANGPFPSHVEFIYVLHTLSFGGVSDLRCVWGRAFFGKKTCLALVAFGCFSDASTAFVGSSHQLSLGWIVSSVQEEKAFDVR
jgi:hypothetical protein